MDLDEPLGGQIGLHHGFAPIALAERHGVIFRLGHQAAAVQCLDHEHASFLCRLRGEALSECLLHLRVPKAGCVHARVLIEDGQSRQVVAESRLEVVEIVRGRNFDRARAECAIHQNRVPHNQNLAIGQRQLDLLSDEAIVPRVFGMHGDSGVAQHGFRPCRRDSQMGGRIIGERILNVVELACGVFVLHLNIRECCQAAGTPVD